MNKVLPKRAIRTRYFLPMINGDRSGMKDHSDLISGSCDEYRGSLANGRSVHRDNRINCAYLKVWKGQAKLNVNRNSKNTNPNYGSLRFRRKSRHPRNRDFNIPFCVRLTFSNRQAFVLLYRAILAKGYTSDLQSV